MVSFTRNIRNFVRIKLKRRFTLQTLRAKNRCWVTKTINKSSTKMFLPSFLFSRFITIKKMLFCFQIAPFLRRHKIIIYLFLQIIYDLTTFCTQKKNIKELFCVLPFCMYEMYHHNAETCRIFSFKKLIKNILFPFDINVE